jgi:type I restriction enzyme, R subunit
MIVHNLLNAYDKDILEQEVRLQNNLAPDEPVSDLKMKEVQKQLQKKASKVFNGELNSYLDNVRKKHEQILDKTNIDKVTFADWDASKQENAQSLVAEFKSYIEAHEDEIIALTILYDQPYRRRELTFQMIKDLLSIMKADKPILMPTRIWFAYETLEKVSGKKPENELIALVSLLRRVMDIDKELTPFDKTVDRNFQNWVFGKHAGTPVKFTPEQMDWLRMIKDFIASSFHIDKDDFELTPFDAYGGIGKMYQLFGTSSEEILQELNEALNL